MFADISDTWVKQKWHSLKHFHLGFSWVSICWMMLSIQAVRSRTMLKKRNFSAVSTSCVRRPSEASSRPFQASITSFSEALMASALSPAYWAWSLEAVSWNCWTWRTDEHRGEAFILLMWTMKVKYWLLLALCLLLHIFYKKFLILATEWATKIFLTINFEAKTRAERYLFSYFPFTFKNITRSNNILLQKNRN